MNRAAAIEAGARAAALWLEDDWDEMDPEDQEKTREYAAAVIDAALPQLVGEPVGYTVLDASKPPRILTWAPEPLDVARRLAQVADPRGATVVALIPVVEP